MATRPNPLQDSLQVPMMHPVAQEGHPSDWLDDVPQKEASPARSEDRDSGLNWLFVDLNSYFASVEQEVRPELRGRPVGVVPMMADTTVCIPASYEAKAFGVKTGTIVGEAKRICPELVLVEA